MNFQFWSIIVGCVFIFPLFRLFKRLLEWRKFVATADKLPGVKTTKFYSILGNVLEIAGPREDNFRKIAAFINKFSNHPIVVLWFTFDLRAVLIKAEAVESLLSNTTNLDKGDVYSYLRKWLGFGLLTSSGQKWHSRRKMLTPSFHFKILEDFIEVFNEQAQILTRNLDKHVGKESFNVYPYISLCTLDIICETAMSQSINAQGNRESEYVKAVNGLVETLSSRGIRPWLHWNWVYYNLSSFGRLEKKNLSIVHSFTDNVIAERRRDYKAKKALGVESENDTPVFGKKRRLAFLDTLLDYSENGKRLSNESIREEVDTFMFEGHDTTSSGIIWTLFLLGHNPIVQQKVHEELDRIFGDSDRHVTSADLAEMKYVECAIKEAFRIYPPVPFFSRSLKKDIQFDGYKVPAGATAAVGVYFLHRDPRYFPDPEKYDPDRFLPENSSKRHPYAYVPFSAGARNCIGQKFALMEEKIVVSTLMRNFKVTSTQGRDEITVVAELILRPADGMWIKLESRKP